MILSQEKEYIFAVVCVVLCGILIYREFSPLTRLNYSKFTSNQKSGITIPSRLGMLIIYGPSLLLSVYLVVITFDSNRLFIISMTSLFHYAKRVYEVLYVHHYSGKAKLMDNVSISMCYMTYLVLVNVFSNQIQKVNPSLFWLGLILFFTGEYINYYHHLILSRLRTDGSKKYKIPTGGLFHYMWCPHYFGEIITFIAIGLLSQHYIIFILQLGSAGYLGARAYNTRVWYQKTFKVIPQRACLLPGIF